MSDIEIARNAKLNDIRDVAKGIGLNEEEIESYGKYKAKITEDAFKRLENKENGKLVLVTAINPTPLGEGKTTMSIGLADGLKKIGKKSILALREPSLRTCIWNKGWCNRWWICANSPNGRYKSTFYRRYTCNNSSKQPTFCYDR